ncbi:MAG TPA: ATP-binding protein, partial [Polyangiales bacterium]|nr:ATP-binding protein [Polyangiales bacterium]
MASWARRGRTLVHSDTKGRHARELFSAEQRRMTQSELALRLRALFAEELEEQLLAGNEHLLALEQQPSDAEQLRSLFRVMHTLKGAARAAGFPELERECHVLESTLASARDRSRPLSSDEVKALFEGLDRLAVAGASLRGAQAAGAASIAEVSTRDEAGHVSPTPVVVPIVQAPSIEAVVSDPPQDTSIRVAQDRVDELFTISNRLLVLSAAVEAQPDEVERLADESMRASTAWRRLRRALPVHTADSPIAREIDAMDALLESVRKSSASLLGGSLRTGRDLGRLSREVSRAARELRMRPFGDVVGDLPRLVRDVAATTGKEVALEMSGETVQADRAVLARLHEGIVHLVRNAIDHGIEIPSARVAAGKPSQGVVRVGASLIGDRIVVTVEDDGAGMDVAAMRRKIAERGEAVPTDDRAVVRRLFLGGVSTRASATAISGRGVGLDAVRAVAERVRGGVDVSWVAGRGTVFTIEAPLTLATVRAVLTRVAATRIAIPAAFVERMFRVKPESLHVVEGRLAVATGDAPAPIVSLAVILGPPLIDRPPDGAVSLLVLRVGARRIALRVDELLEEIEVVVRPVRAHGRVAVQHISGAAMLPNGTVALVLNPTAAIATALGLPPDVTPIGLRVEKSAKRKRVLVVDDSITTRTLEASVLEAAGYEVATAFDGADAWRLLQERGADLVVSDVEMPRMDGLALTETMRSSTRFRE